MLRYTAVAVMYIAVVGCSVGEIAFLEPGISCQAESREQRAIGGRVGRRGGQAPEAVPQGGGASRQHPLRLFIRLYSW